MGNVHGVEGQVQPNEGPAGRAVLLGGGFLSKGTAWFDKNAEGMGPGEGGRQLSLAGNLAGPTNQDSQEKSGGTWGLAFLTSGEMETDRSLSQKQNR